MLVNSPHIPGITPANSASQTITITITRINTDLSIIKFPIDGEGQYKKRNIALKGN